MDAANSIVRRLDHVVFRTDSPETLFPLFADALQLPVVRDVATHDFFTSGVVFAGNVYFEMMRFGRAGGARAARTTAAEIWGMAFEPRRLRDSLEELRRRDIPHGPPFYSIGERIDGRHGRAFTNVTVGKLLSDSRNFYLGKRFGGNSPLNLALGELTSRVLTFAWAGAVVGRAMDDTMVYICEYTHDNDRLRASMSDELKARRGGPLGVERVEEVVLGVRDFERKRSGWQDFLSPLKPSGPAAWRLPEGGPSIRLVPSARNVIERLVLKVASLEGAKRALAGRGLLAANEGGRVCVEPSKVQGLDIRLAE